MAFKQWAVGEEMVAADFQTYLQNQTIPAFATAAQRDSLWVGAPNGARCVTADTDTEWSRVGGVWTVARGQQVGFAQVTVVQASITTLADLSGLSVTFTAAGAGRRYRVTGGGLVTSSTVADLIVGYIRDGTNAQLQRWAQLFQVGTASTGIHCEGAVYVSPPAGAYTVKLSLERSVGSGVLQFQASAQYPGFLSVEAV